MPDQNKTKINIISAVCTDVLLYLLDVRVTGQRLSGSYNLGQSLNEKLIKTTPPPPISDPDGKKWRVLVLARLIIDSGTVEGCFYFFFCSTRDGSFTL